MIKKEDFIWKEYHVNNIETNPIQGIYCIIDVGNNARKYEIRPQYPLHENKYIRPDKDKPECYILFEAIGHKATEEDKKNYFYNSLNYNDYIFNSESFNRVFKNLEEAKEYAYVLYSAIFGYVLSHIVDDTETATKNHFVVK